MSNIAVTEGSGKSVATETIGGVEYGLIKLIDPTAASTTVWGTDAGTYRVSALIDSGSVSAKGTVSAFINEGTISARSTDAGTLLVSAKQGDAALLRVSGIIDSGSISAKGTISAFINEGSISAKSGDAGQLLISAKQGDAGLLHVSAVGTLTVSAHEVKQSDAAALRVSAILAAGVSSVGAASFAVSAAQADASALRVSSFIVPQTAGGLSTHMSLSVSASQNVKSSAGQLYGYYAFNKDTKVNFLKLYNVSGAVNLGTDTPVLTIPLPISGGANVFSNIGVPFSTGIGIAATSGLPVDNTALPAASAVTVDLFYK